MFNENFSKTALGFPPNRVFGSVAKAMRNAPGGLPKAQVGFKLPKIAMVVPFTMGPISAAVAKLGRPIGGKLQRSIKEIPGGFRYGFERVAPAATSPAVAASQEARRVKRMKVVRAKAYESARSTPPTAVTGITEY